MRCTRCLYDGSIPNITFDDNGVCNYCHIHDEFEKEYPTGKKGKKILDKLIAGIKKDGKKRKYDVIVGFSGGCDSSYLLYLTKQWGLRPLAVHFDNGWNSPIAYRNMMRVADKLKVDLETLTVDYDEYNDLCRAFLKSGVGDIDIPNDIALTATLYRYAEANKVKHIFIGHSFRTEGIAPIGWTYMDGKYVESVHKRYGLRKLRTYPNLLMRDFIRWVGKIQRHRPLYYVDYIKEDAKKLLSEKLGWEWYGGHHMENIFTAFEICYFLPRRYGIDMRLLGHSALVRSGQLPRDKALKEISLPVVCPTWILEEVKKRLSIGLAKLIDQPKKTHNDFETYEKSFKRFKWFWWLMYKLKRIPKSFYIKYAN